MKKGQFCGAVLAGILGFFLVVFWLRSGGSADGLLSALPASPFPAAGLLLGLYALKGLTFFLPLSALETAGGLLFPLPQALAVNLLGVFAAMAGPYLLGRRKQEGLSALLARQPKLQRLWEKRTGESDFLFVFLLRMTGGLPFDAVSFCLGAAGIPARVYFPAGLLGVVPHLAAVTVFGSALSDPASPEFFCSLALNAAVSLLALMLFRIRTQKRNRI